METRFARVAFVFIAVMTLTRTHNVSVAAPPSAGFGAIPTSGIRPLTVNFSDTSTGSVSAWSWNFGDNATSTEQNPVHTYAFTGVYTVTLTVSGPDGSATASKPSFITVLQGIYLPSVFRQGTRLFETALFLDGVDDYASAPDSVSLHLGTYNTDDFTIETFFYVPDLANSNVDTLIWKPDSYGVYIIYDASLPDQVILRIWTNSANYVELSYDVDLAVGWHHVAAVFDNETTDGKDLRALYLDGSLVASDNGTDWNPGLPVSGSDLNIGGYPAYPGVLYPVAGWMAEIRFSDIVRYSGAFYTVPTGSFANDANTRALWHFNEAPGSTIFADSSGNGNTLFGHNGAHTGHP